MTRKELVKLICDIMKSSNIKKEKEQKEYFEEVDDEVFGTDTYQSPFVIYINELTDKFNRFKKSKLFLPIMCGVGFLLFVIIVYLSFHVNKSNSNTKIEDIDIKIPEIIYLDNETKFDVNVYGYGSLEKTTLKFSLSTGSYASLEKTELVGSSVTNKIIPKETGSFIIFVDAKNGNKKFETKSKQIAICKQLTTEVFETTELNVDISKTTRIKLDVGKPEVCNESVKYKIEDTTIAAFTTNDKIIGLKKGTTKIIATLGTQKVELTIKVG